MSKTSNDPIPSVSTKLAVVVERQSLGEIGFITADPALAFKAGSKAARNTIAAQTVRSVDPDNDALVKRVRVMFNASAGLMVADPDQMKLSPAVSAELGNILGMARMVPLGATGFKAAEALQKGLKAARDEAMVAADGKPTDNTSSGERYAWAACMSSLVEAFEAADDDTRNDAAARVVAHLTQSGAAKFYAARLAPIVEKRKAAELAAAEKAAAAIKAEAEAKAREAAAAEGNADPTPAAQTPAAQAPAPKAQAPAAQAPAAQAPAAQAPAAQTPAAPVTGETKKQTATPPASTAQAPGRPPLAALNDALQESALDKPVSKQVAYQNFRKCVMAALAMGCTADDLRQTLDTLADQHARRLSEAHASQETKPAPKAETKPAPKAPKPAPKAETKPAPKAETKPAPKAETKPAPKADPAPKAADTSAPIGITLN